MKQTKSTLIIAGILLISLFSIVPIQAQEEIADLEDIDLAGITPDSFFYPLELALERITELFSENAKLEHARERLAEVRVMIQENKLVDAERARGRFENLKLRIKDQTLIENEITLSNDLGSRISTIVSGGELSETQISEIRTMVSNYRTNK